MYYCFYNIIQKRLWHTINHRKHRREHSGIVSSRQDLWHSRALARCYYKKGTPCYAGTPLFMSLSVSITPPTKKGKYFFEKFSRLKMSTLNSTFFHVFIVLPFCTIRSLFYCIFSLLGSAIVRLPLLPASHAPYFHSYASCFTSSSNSSPAE